MKLTTKSLLRSPNESMVPGGSFSDPFKVVEKYLHITSLEYPYSDIRFLYESRLSTGSVFSSQTRSQDGSLNLKETLTFITLFVNGGLVCLTKPSTVTDAFALVLMASI